jgi:hypothetical protein
MIETVVKICFPDEFFANISKHSLVAVIKGAKRSFYPLQPPPGCVTVKGEKRREADLLLFG